MAVSKTQKATSNIGQAILNTPLQIMMNRIMYVVLLVAFLVIGYLVGKVQTLESDNKSSEVASASTSTPQQAAPQAPTPPPVEEVLANLKVGHLPPEGNENAPVTIIEFSDFECPFCASFFKDTLPQIRSEYVETGKVKIYFRHQPLPFHPQAKPLAIASECANDQGSFWQMHDKIFENSASVATSNVETHKEWALELGLNSAQFNDCVDSQQHVDLINEDSAAGNEFGATGTPTFFINGRQVIGAQPFAAFKTIIDEELNK